jgi:hypothetical protein
MVVCFDVAVGVDQGEADDAVGGGPAHVAAVGGSEKGREGGSEGGLEVAIRLSVCMRIVT